MSRHTDDLVVMNIAPVRPVCLWLVAGLVPMIVVDACGTSSEPALSAAGTTGNAAGAAGTAGAGGIAGSGGAPWVDASVPDAEPSGGSGGQAGDPALPVHATRACTAGRVAQVDVLEDALVRIHFVINGTPQPDRGWLFDVTSFAGPHGARVDDTADKLQIETSALRIELAGTDCALSITATDGTALWKEGAPFQRDDNGKLNLTRTLAAGERIYGLGEKTGNSMRRGRAYDLWNTDPFSKDGHGYSPNTDPIYQSHPYVLALSSAGHASAAFLANTWRSRFDVGSSNADLLKIGTDGGDADLFVLDGPTPAQVLERYTRLVGRPMLPPRWAIGYHQSRWSYTPSARLEAVGAEFRKRKLPADGLWLDVDYMNGYRDFTWSPSAFGDAKNMLARLAATGFKVTTIFDPGVKSDPGGSYAAYNDGIKAKAFILGTNGAPLTADQISGQAVFPDFTQPGARSFWADHLAAFLQIGLHGAWIDVNEPAALLPLDVKVAGDGVPATFAEVKNVYAKLEAQATFAGELQAFPNRRPFILSRSGCPGIQRYAAVWTGDMFSAWDHLGMAPSMLQGMSVSGVPFVGTDVGGFLSGATAELYGRWFELGSFSPFFRSHVTTGAPDQDPWSFGTAVEDAARKVLNLRYQLLPYWYEAFAEAHRSGMPIMRPLWFEFPADAEAGKHEDEFFVGPSLLVAPVVVAKVTARQVYLPVGIFQDFYTGASYTGPTTITVQAPLGQVPLFVRGGSVIHAQDAQNYVDEVPSARHYLDVYAGKPGAASTTTITEDDGETLGYEKGEVSSTTLSLNVTATGITLTTTARTGGFTPPAYPLTLRVHGVAAKPSAATIDGAAGAVTYDQSAKLAQLEISSFAAPHTLTMDYVIGN